MTKGEFEGEWNRLVGSYPVSGMRDADKYLHAKTFFERLQVYPARILHDAMDKLIDIAPGERAFFPALSRIVQLCEAGVVAERPAFKAPTKPGVLQEAHTCHPNVEKMRQRAKENKPIKFTEARESLRKIAPYEATHVECRGDIHPACPKCGAIQEAWANSRMVDLMKKYPEQTKTWNPLHKGFLLCDQCIWPKDEK